MKTFKYEVTTTVTAYIEVEAENEEEARQNADYELGNMTVGELKEWETNFYLKSETERCDYCYKDFDVDTEELKDYDGGRYCHDCIEELEASKKEDEYLKADYEYKKNRDEDGWEEHKGE